MNKAIAPADVNNCYVSCECVFNPSLIGKPVVVLSKELHRLHQFQQFRF